MCNMTFYSPDDLEAAINILQRRLYPAEQIWFFQEQTVGQLMDLLFELIDDEDVDFVIE